MVWVKLLLGCLRLIVFKKIYFCLLFFIIIGFKVLFKKNNFRLVCGIDIIVL